MQYLAAAVVALALALVPACTDEAPADAPRTCQDVAGDYWLEVAIDGLDDGPVTLYGVESEGAAVTVLRTPTQRNGFAEARLPGDRWLTLVVFDDTVRVFVQQVDGQVGPEHAVLTIAVGDQQTRTELAPTYQHAMVGAVQCAALVPTIDRLSIGQ